MTVLPNPSSDEKRRFRLQRWLALGLLCLEIGATGYLGRTIVFSLLILVVALVGALSSIRFQPDRQRSYDLIAGLGIVFSVKYLVAPDNLRYVGLLPSQQIAFTVSQFFLAVQAAEFFITRRDRRIPAYFPGLGVGALVCAAIIEVTPRERQIFLLTCVGFAVLAVAFCDSSRRFTPARGRKSVGRPVAAVMTLTLIGVFGWSAATMLHRYEKEMDRFVLQFLDSRKENADIGFSDISRLGSVSLQKSIVAEDIALRIESLSPPTYLRGRAFDEYQNQQWMTEPSKRVLKKPQTRPSLLEESGHTGNVFRIANLRSPSTNRFTIWPSRKLSGTLFAPRGVRYLEAAAEFPTINTFGILQADDAVPGAPYSVFTDDAVDRDSLPAGEDRMRMMATPPEWAVQDPVLRQRAQEICAGKVSVQDKIGAVINWFRERGRYSLEVTVPDGLAEDSVAWFLKENPPAHCEYFASGTAVLLRMAGVPCRYVTGFLITEQNPFGGSWIARNRDAHAWVEAWNGEDWIIVETTPADGIPTATVTDSWRSLWEYLLGRMQRIRAAWQQRRFGHIGDLALALITTPIGLSYLAILILVVALARHRTRRQRMRTEISNAVSKDLLQMQSTLKSVDRAVRQFVGRRLPGETLLTFAARLDVAGKNSPSALREAAHWYRQYSTLRYAGDRGDAESEALQSQARQLLPELKRLKKSGTTV